MLGCVLLLATSKNKRRLREKKQPRTQIKILATVLCAWYCLLRISHSDRSDFIRNYANILYLRFKNIKVQSTNSMISLY